jgi:DNA-binding SARP family transcriptional activator/TolB-like protein
MAFRLETFGGLRVIQDDGELDWLLGQRSRVALLVYLAVEQRVSRESVSAFFWPDSDTDNARRALRQAIYQLRSALGTRWLDARVHELRVTPAISTDTHAFSAALDRGDVEMATRLYGGPFLDGMHLVDSKSWESWVDGRRTLYARAFRRACRECLEARRQSGDLLGAVDSAQRWVARDPYDDEAQHRLIDALAAAGERAEAIRQYEAYVRLMEQDGLRPLDETAELVDRVRTEPGGLPPVGPMDGAPPRAAPPAEAWASGGNGGFPGIMRRPLALLAMVTVALTLATAALWTAGQKQAGPSPALSPTAIAVLPFTVRGADESSYMGEGMVNLLGTALDAAGLVTPVDPRAIFTAIGEDGAAVTDPSDGSRIAARIGAGLFVLGELIQAGDRLQIEAAVYGEQTTEPRARAVVSGEAHDLFDLVDRLATRLLADLGDPQADRLLRTAAVTTASLPAFRAYLEGETLMRAGRFERAADAYVEALSHDSTFAVAHYRLALAREWAPLPGIGDAADAAARHAGRVSPRDRDLLEAYGAWRAGEALEAERRYRAIVNRYPHDIEAWFQLGEVLFHHGPLMGRRLEDSEHAWRIVLGSEPRNPFAITHLGRLAAIGGRVAMLDSLLAPFSPDERRSDRRLAEIVLTRALAAGDSAATRGVVHEMRHWEQLSVWRVAAWLTAFGTDPARTRGVLRSLMEDHRTPDLRADLLWYGSVLELAEGRTRAAATARAEAAAAELAVPPERRRWGFEPVIEWHAATLALPYTDSTLERAYRAARRVDVSRAEPAADATNKPTRSFENVLGLGRGVRVEPLRQYTLGVLALRLREPAFARAAADSLRILAAADANRLTRDLERGLTARLAAHEGRPEEALRLMESLELGDSQGDMAVIPFLTRANERYLRAELLAELGREAESLRWLEGMGYGSVGEIPFRAPAHLRQAEIHETLGNRAEAADHYRRFLELWRNADPEFQPKTESARRRLAELAGQDASRPPR